MNQQDSIRHWDEKALTRKADPRVVAAFAAPKLAMIRRHLSAPTPTILEVGCGDGYLSRFLVEFGELTGADASEGMLARNPIPNKIRADACALPFLDNSFDIVVCSNMLHHLPEPARAVSEMARVSKSLLFLSEPNGRNPAMFITHAIEPDERGALKFNTGLLTRLLEAAGMQVIEKRSAGQVTPNKTPIWMLPFLQWWESFSPFGMFAMAIGKK